jgi:Bacterial Ig-like domain/RTX calcium-binding nonapeptide repeat (4 copies)/Domain of unknown function (DUF5122) beta-propeller
MMIAVAMAMAVSMLAAAGVAWAQEAEPSPTPNPTPDDTWMTNGIVYSVIRSGEYIYVGGKFDRVRSAASGGKSFAVKNLARFDADTGVGDPSWRPAVTGVDPKITKVYALAAAGGKIWVGGKFDAIAEQPGGTPVARRNLAAVSEAAPVAVDPDVDPLVGSETNTSNSVRALLASDTKVYVGGIFSSIDGKFRSNLGAFDLSGNLDEAWRPKTQGQVRGLAFASDKATVFASGKFRSAAGSDGDYQPRETLARFDPTSGSLNPWAVPADSVSNDQVAADIAVTANRISAGYLGNNYVRSFQLDNGDTGTKVWEKKCAGDVQTVAMLGPDKLVIGGHFSQVDGIKRTRIALLNLSDGSLDPWAPAVDGEFFGPWDLLVDEQLGHLYVGGGFTTVAGLPRTYLARFSWDVPDTTSPTITSVAPADGQTDVALGANVEATFSEEMDAASVTDPANFTLTKQDGTPEGTQVPATLSYNSSTKKATLDPDADLDPQSNYTATIKGGTDGVKDSSGNPLASDELWSFTTTLPCTIVGTSNSETITGTPADDVICAGAGNDTIKALEGNDTIKGEGGADQLYGELGDDDLDGGLGTDTANFSGSLASVIASLADGTASGEGSDSFSSVENLFGSNLADTLTGSATNNTLNGAGGADSIVGLEGADALKGSGGGDTLDSRDGVEGNDALDGGTGTDTCTTDATELSIVGCEL